MPRPDYYNLRLTKETKAHIRAICVRLGLDPDEWGAYSKAINLALRLTALGMVGEEDE